MTDVASHTPSRPTGRRRRDAEFNVYFTLIFLTALPFVSVGWVRDVIRRRTLNLHGPLARAWCEADRITPLIFSA
ncbi:cytochrome PufQ [Lutimaribacter marinistellae]|uniref:Cytochrome PufQ n=1 Tax=Lutimaribacter marinistellae TaxID=1820329 RepID=A0ABV7TII3_9RHOB